MIQKYKSASKLTKIFLWLSVFLLTILVLMYTFEVRHALAMDPNSFNCLNDSMMKQICDDPYRSSITWTFIKFGFFAHPLLIAWIVIGILLLIRLNSGDLNRNNG